MKRVITAAVLIPLVLLLLLKGSFPVLVAATALVAELATWEYLFIAGCHGSRRTLVLIAIAVLFAATFFSPALILPSLGLSSIVLVLVCSFASPLERVLGDSAFSIFPLLYRFKPGHIAASLGTTRWSLAPDLSLLHCVDR